MEQENKIVKKRAKTKNKAESVPVQKVKIDLGNKNYKMKYGQKNIIDYSSVQEVEPGTYGAFIVNDKYYIIGGNAKSKKTTNKICETKKALLARALFPIVEDKGRVEITALLPLSLYLNVENRTKFEDLLKGKYIVKHPEGATKSFNVTKVDVCGESFSSLVTNGALLKESLYLVDIGGVDITGVHVNGTPNPDKLFTAERGMNLYFTELGKYLTSKVLCTYTDQDAELLFNKYDELKDDNMRELIDNFSRVYIKTHIYEPLMEIGYKPLIHKLVFVGGGSKALERYIKKDENAEVLKNALWSNVEGAEIISIRRGN